MIKQDLKSESHHNQLNQVKQLLDKNELSAGLALLMQLRDSIALDTSDPNVSFRLFSNLGTCYLRLENFSAARDCYGLAAKAAPESPRGQANLANVDYIELKVDDSC